MSDLAPAQTYENHIPAAVRAAAARADAIHAELSAPLEEEPEEISAEPSETPPVEAPVEPTETPPAPDWEQRYRSLQGKFDAEVPALRSQIGRLEQLLATMQQPPAEPASPVTTVPVAVPPEDIAEYGDDLPVAARRWARLELQGDIASLRAEIGELRSGQQQFRSETVQDRTNRMLDADPEIGGRWHQINNDPEFHAWLGQRDPFSGEIRLNMLREAYATGDAERTGRFFKTFLAEHTATHTPAPAAPVQTPQPEEADGRPRLEDLAAPGRATGSVTGGAPAEKRVWTNQDIRRFYRDRMQGKYRGRDEEAQRVEQDIFAAASEGRIR